MLKLYLSSLGRYIRFVSSSQEVHTYLSDVRERQIPDYGVELNADKNHVAEIRYVDSEERCLEIDEQGTSVTVSMPAFEIHWMDFEFLVLAIFNHHFMKDLMVCTNGVLVEKGGRAVLLLGEYGSGKSVVALRLRTSGFRVLAYDRVVLALKSPVPCAVSGTSQVRLRPGTIERYFPSMLQSPDLRRRIAGQDEWLTQVTIPQSLVPAVPETRYAIPISAVYQVHVFPDATTAGGFSMPLADSTYLPALLYRYLTRYVMGYELAFLGLARLLPRIETANMRDFRWSLAGIIASTRPCRRVEGGLEYVARTIIRDHSATQIGR